MRAMILAAGLGTRLKPITDKIPKALIPVLGKPMIRHTLDVLKKGGLHNVIINLHYLPKALKAYLKTQKDIHISYSVEKKLLGTGGGIAKAHPFFKNERFVVINSDVLIDIDLKKVIQFHMRKKALATMVVKRATPQTPYDLMGLDSEKKIVHFKSWGISPLLIKTFFTGIHIFEPNIFDYFPKHKGIFCINNDVYSKLIKKKLPVFGYLHNGAWEDMGTLSLYLEYHQKHLNKEAWSHFKEKLLKLAPGITFPNTLG